MVIRDVIKEINNEFFESVSSNLSLSSIIEQTVKSLSDSSPAPSSYYFLTDLTNPQQKFWKIIAPHVKKSDALTKKLIMGNKLQTKFSNWCRLLPGFQIEEGLLDGAYVGIPRVKGRVDYIINNMIVELKTKEKIPESVNEVFEMYPNDLEQLVFYSALHPNNPEKNILLFMHDKSPFSIKVFEVITKNFDAIKSMIKERIKLLDEALSSSTKEKPFEKLGKCRYHIHGCEFHNAGVCRCDRISPIDLSKLKGAIEIQQSDEFKKKLEEKIKEFENSSSIKIYPNNIIAPRQQFMTNVLEIERSDFEGMSDKFVFRTCLSSAIYKSKLNQFAPEEKEKLQENLFDKRFSVPFSWLRLPSSSAPGNEVILPYIVTVNMTNSNYGRPSSYHIAELGIICASYDVNKGVILTMFPKLNKLVNAFEISYKQGEIKRTQDMIRNVINEIESAQKEEHLSMLHICPDFMDKNHDCPIQDKCKEINEYCNPKEKLYQ